MSASSKYSLYVFVVLVGCVVALFVGMGMFRMYQPLDRDNPYSDIAPEQKAYMRNLRRLSFNALAIAARRPDCVYIVS